MAIVTEFERAVLGRTGLEVFRLGISASYGLGAAGVEAAVEAGVDYVYWGSMRKRSFGEGVRNLLGRGHRDRMKIVVQSYSRLAILVRPSLECALKRLGAERADFLLLGWWNKRPSQRMIDAALACKEAGLVRHVALSTHHRPLAAELAGDSPFDVIHVRYNACYRGAEREVFPLLPPAPRGAGIVAFTATRWGTLLKAPAGLPPDVPVPSAGDCYRFVLSNPAVGVCLSGPKDEAELQHALAAVAKGPMDEAELAWMRRFGDCVYGAKDARNFVERVF